jgi:hypothetical protein
MYTIGALFADSQCAMSPSQHRQTVGRSVVDDERSALIGDTQLPSGAHVIALGEQHIHLNRLFNKSQSCYSYHELHAGGPIEGPLPGVNRACSSEPTLSKLRFTFRTPRFSHAYWCFNNKVVEHSVIEPSAATSHGQSTTGAQFDSYTAVCRSDARAHHWPMHSTYIARSGHASTARRTRRVYEMHAA